MISVILRHLILQIVLLFNHRVITTTILDQNFFWGEICISIVVFRLIKSALIFLTAIIIDPENVLVCLTTSTYCLQRQRKPSAHAHFLFVRACRPGRGVFTIFRPEILPPIYYINVSHSCEFVYCCWYSSLSAVRRWKWPLKLPLHTTPTSPLQDSLWDNHNHLQQVSYK